MSFHELDLNGNVTKSTYFAIFGRRKSNISNSEEKEKLIDSNKITGDYTSSEVYSLITGREVVDMVKDRLKILDCITEDELDKGTFSCEISKTLHEDLKLKTKGFCKILVTIYIGEIRDHNLGAYVNCNETDGKELVIAGHHRNKIIDAIISVYIALIDNMRETCV